MMLHPVDARIADEYGRAMTREQMIDEAVRKVCLKIITRTGERYWHDWSIRFAGGGLKEFGIYPETAVRARAEFRRIAERAPQYAKPGLLPHGVRWPVNTDPGGLTWIDA